MTKLSFCLKMYDMERDIEQNIQLNLVELRKSRKLKQADLAEKIGYSDKAISRWENGSSVPDIASLSILADFYGISLDDIVKENANEKASLENKSKKREEMISELTMLSLSVVTVWLIAVIIYVGLSITKNVYFWQIFVCGVPVSMIILYRFNRKTLNIRWVNTILLSVIVWSIFTLAFFLTLNYLLW
ncbi:MAG: helix-turn-helix transcriptional regulator, partial [Firmicutes bacterium]|nr:helix-turn-helix transcriptional regulator [Candidatus Caballimonas caccae]